MHQKHTDISKIDRILLKIYHKFHQNHCIINQLTIEKQIIQMNRITKTSISKNKRKIQERADIDSFQLQKASYC